MTDQKMTRYYLYGSERIAMKTIKTGQSDVLTYVLADHLGSASITTNAAGARVAEQRYKAWGEERYTYVASGTVQTVYLYTGQRNDPGLGGLMFYNARWYDPALARFAQADTIIPGPGSSLAWDRYSYALNSPLMYNDPSGHYWHKPGELGMFYDPRDTGRREIITPLNPLTVNAGGELDPPGHNGTDYDVANPTIYASAAGIVRMADKCHYDNCEGQYVKSCVNSLGDRYPWQG